MAYKSAKILALAALLTLVEGKTNQGAVGDVNNRGSDTEITVNNYIIPAPITVRTTIDNVLDTIDVSSEVITKDFLKTKIFIHSSNKEYNPVYASMDKVVDSLKIDSSIVNQNFVKNYFRTVMEEDIFYNKRQVKVRNILDTLALGSELVNRKFRKAISKIESEYGLRDTSHVGALGPMQTMPQTFRLHSKKSIRYYGTDPLENIIVGVKYLLAVEQMFNYDNNFKKIKGNWNNLSTDAQEEFLAASYNGGYGRLTARKFNIRRMPRETVNYIEWFKDAKLLISIEDVFDFHQFPDTTYSYNSRVSDLTNYLSSIESYISKNYSKWSKMDDAAKKDLIVASSVLGPRRMVSLLKKPHKAEWNFRTILPEVYSRINNFNDLANIRLAHNKWDYSDPKNITNYMVNQRIIQGLEELSNIEEILLDTYSAWNIMTIESKQELVLLSSIYGIDAAMKPVVGSKELLVDANKILELYSKQSRSEALMNYYFSYHPSRQFSQPF